MEVPDKVGRALPLPENATSVRAWKFTVSLASNCVVNLILFCLCDDAKHLIPPVKNEKNQGLTVYNI